MLKFKTNLTSFVLLTATDGNSWMILNFQLFDGNVHKFKTIIVTVIRSKLK